jgi:hypothetical protein
MNSFAVATVVLFLVGHIFASLLDQIFGTPDFWATVLACKDHMTFVDAFDCKSSQGSKILS